MQRSSGLEFVSCDVREEEQVQAAVEQAAKADGGLRIAISCAGTGWAQKVAGSKGPHPLMPFEIIIAINLSARSTCCASPPAR